MSSLSKSTSLHARARRDRGKVAPADRIAPCQIAVGELHEASPNQAPKQHRPPRSANTSFVLLSCCLNIIHCYEAREQHIRPEAYATSRRHQDSAMDNHVLVIALIPFVEWNSDGFL